MKIYIHTRGRVDDQVTLHRLKAVHRHVWLVVPHSERKAHDYPRVISVPPEIKNLSMKRQWILENTYGDKFVLIDDDLAFYRRKEPGNFQLVYTTDQDIKDMYSWLDRMLDEYAHVAISARELNHKLMGNLIMENYRALRVLGYRREILKSYRCRFDRLPIMADFDMTLQLLRKGFPNRVNFEFAHGQWRGSQAKGGCSAYRTAEMMKDTAYALAELHPGFVKVVQRKIKCGGDFWSERYDVQVKWKKAYQSSFGFDLG